MPRFDSKGPEGKGPQTGRKMGKCASSDQSKDNSSNTDESLGRRGARRRRGLGRAFGFGRNNA